uniref:Uncharacterized protein n=1 Tax=Octopus bimaculoides TaxID=37653 RepID=A0A0L8ID34_OCTBM
MYILRAGKQGYTISMHNCSHTFSLSQDVCLIIGCCPSHGKRDNSHQDLLQNEKEKLVTAI